MTVLPNGQSEPVVLMIDEDDADEETAVSGNHQAMTQAKVETSLTDAELEQAVWQAEAEKMGVETAVTAPTESADFLAKNGNQGG
mgnify:CR=1 FL=1